jgi:tetratricopeptide (TPR) repeat protein
MATSARLAILALVSLLPNIDLIAQSPQQNATMSPMIAAVAGKVLGADGRPLPGIHVEIDDARTALPVTSTYTQSDGSFELYNIPKGDYEVIAESTNAEVSNAISIDSGRSSLELQLPQSRSEPSPVDETTSVARMLVPSKAQRLYNRAFQYFTKGKYDEAEKEADAALQIDEAFGQALALVGLIEVHKGDFTLAENYLQKAIKVDPSASGAYIALAAIYNHQGRFDDAMSASEKGLSFAPRTWQAYLELGKASIAKSLYATGLKFLRQAERLGGNAYAEVHLVKAYALVPLKLYKDARYELHASMVRDRHGNVANQAQEMLAKVSSLESAGTTTQP